MSLITRHQLPRFIQRGVVSSLDMDVYDEAGTQLTATAGTLTVYAGSKVIVDAADLAATLGPPATYSLAAALTADESLSEEWLEVWDLTFTNQETDTFRRPAYLVRHRLLPVITDTDLTDLHSDLAALRDPDQSSYQAQREAGWVRMLRRLISKGRFPQLITDSWALAELHRFITLEIIFRDFAQSTGDGRWLKQADDYRILIKQELENIQFNYDADEDGLIDEDEKLAGEPVIFLNRAPEHEWGGW